MLQSLNILAGSSVTTLDGEVGTVDDFLMDDERWVVRYLVVNAGDWLLGRRVLVPAAAVERPDPAADEWRIRLTKEQLQGSPEIDADAPLSRAQEAEYLQFFAFPLYWSGGAYWGSTITPGMIAAVPDASDPTPDIGAGLSEDSAEEEPRCYLRKASALNGYTVIATDEEVGHVDDLVIDDVTWAVVYVAIGLGTWLPGKRVLVPADAFDSASWADGRVDVRLGAEVIRTATDWEPLERIPPDYERTLAEHYGGAEHASVS